MKKGRTNIIHTLLNTCLYSTSCTSGAQTLPRCTSVQGDPPTSVQGDGAHCRHRRVVLTPPNSHASLPTPLLQLIPTATACRCQGFCSPATTRSRHTAPCPLLLRRAFFCLGNQLFRLPWFQREVAVRVPAGWRMLSLWAALTAVTALLLELQNLPKQRPKPVTQLPRHQGPRGSPLQVLHFKGYEQMLPPSRSFVSSANSRNDQPRSCTWHSRLCPSVL